MHLIRGASLALVCITTTAPALAYEGTAPLGLYVGGGITQSRFDATTFSVDNKDKSWKAIAGWRFQDYAAMEINYVDFGNATAPAVPLGVPSASEANPMDRQATPIRPPPPLPPTEPAARPAVRRAAPGQAAMQPPRPAGH